MSHNDFSLDFFGDYMKNNNIKNLTFSGISLAMCILLPFLTGNDMALGNALCLMHIPVLLCGFACGGLWGGAVGFCAPLIRSLIVSRPPLFPTAFAMAFELCVYGLIVGLLYKKFPKKTPYIYLSLICAMLSGRIVWGAVKYIIMGFGGDAFSLTIFANSVFVKSVLGIILQIVLIPPIVLALRRAKIITA